MENKFTEELVDELADKLYIGLSKEENKMVYVTSDNNLYLDKEEAVAHEYEIMSKKILDNPVMVFSEYRMFRINDEFELNALKYTDKENRTVNVDVEEIEFPIIITEKEYEGEYYEYELIEDTLMWYESMAEAFRDIIDYFEE